MDKKKILFVCLGNICRSPSAEAVFAGIAKNRGMAHQFEIDSAGTHAYHAGEPADKRMRAHARKRGFDLLEIFRPEGFMLSTNLVHLGGKRPLDHRVIGPVDPVGQLEPAEDETAARAAERLVGRRRDEDRPHVGRCCGRSLL